MPGHYRNSYENYYNAGNRPIPAGNPYGYSYFNPTGKEQAALTIGSLLAGALAASSGQSKGDAIRKGLAGTMAGYGSGYQNYQNLMGDAFRRDLETKSYGQRIKEYEDSMGLNREKFRQAVKEYEETEKPESLAKTAWYNKRETEPIDENKIRDERTLRRLDIRRKQKDLAGGGEKTTQQLLEEALNEESVGGATKQPSQITLDRFLNEARRVNPGISDDELARYYNKKYGR